MIFGFGYIVILIDAGLKVVAIEYKNRKRLFNKDV